MQNYLNDFSLINDDFKKFFYMTSGIVLVETLTYPFDLIKTKLFSLKPDKGLAELFKKYRNTQNIFKGLNIGYQRSFLNVYGRFFIYDMIIKNNEKKNSSFFDILIPTLISSSIYSVFGNTLNFLKIKIQCGAIIELKQKVDFEKEVSEIFKIKEGKSKFRVFRMGILSFFTHTNLMSLCELSSFFYFRGLFAEKGYSQNTIMFSSIALSSIISTFLLNPIEFLNARYILRDLSNLPNYDFFNYSLKLFQNEGIRIFYQGCFTSMIRNTFFNCFLFAIYNNFIMNNNKNKKID